MEKKRESRIKRKYAKKCNRTEKKYEDEQQDILLAEKNPDKIYLVSNSDKKAEIITAIIALTGVIYTSV